MIKVAYRINKSMLLRKPDVILNDLVYQKKKKNKKKKRTFLNTAIFYLLLLFKRTHYRTSFPFIGSMIGLDKFM